MTWTRKHLLDIESLSAAEIMQVLETARTFKQVGERAIKKVPALRGKTVINLFIEPSTRTRISFELAAVRLTADVINFSTDSSSLKKARPSRTPRATSRPSAPTSSSSATAPPARRISSRASSTPTSSTPATAHTSTRPRPCSTPLPFWKKGRIAGLNVTILGDILYSRVARSNIWALTKLGAKVTLCGPATLVPRVFEEMGCRVTHKVDEAIENADIINLLRIQHERQRKTMFPSIGEYTVLWGLTKQRLEKPSPTCSSCTPARSTAASRSTARSPTAPAPSSSTRSPTAWLSAWPSSSSSTAASMPKAQPRPSPTRGWGKTDPVGKRCRTTGAGRTNGSGR